MPWSNARQVASRSFTCGFCGNVVASNIGFADAEGKARGIFVCPHCDEPSYITQKKQIPGVAPGVDVKPLPPDIDAIYREARNCTANAAYTGAVLLCRKLLMNIAVAQGAAEGKTFVDYIQHLAQKGFVPPNGTAWVDHIRKKGNEATHEIVVMPIADAQDLITFIEMLLKFIYEFPSRVPKANA